MQLKGIPMIDDPIVAEVRQARENYAAQFGNDLRAICRDLQQKQSASGRKVAAFPPQRPKAAVVTTHSATCSE